jgi:hypothetical protein
MGKELLMAANKGKKGRTRKSTTSRKSRLWLRDLLNIVGGLLVGSFGLWIVQGYLEGRTAKEVSQRVRGVVQGDLPTLKQTSEGYEAILESKEDDVSEALRGVELDGPLYGLDAYKRVPEDLPYLDTDERPLLLGFYLNLRDAELLRKLIIEQREHPEQMSQILAREFLRTLHEGTQLAPRLLWALGTNREPDG